MRLIKETTKLYPDQLENARALVSKRRALFIDSTGSGKSLTVLYGFAYCFSKNIVDGLLIATPKNAHDKRVWKPQIEQFTNFRCIDFETVEEKVNRGYNVNSVLSGFQIVYMKHTSVKNNYPLVVSILEHYKHPLMCFDEAHAARTNSALATRLAMVIRHAYAIWGITATDLSRNAMDTFNIVNVIYPGKLGTAADFKARFCTMREKVIGRWPSGQLKKAQEVTGFKSHDEFRAFCSDFLVIGARKLSIKSHLVHYDLSDHERQIYLKIANGLCLGGYEDDEDWIRGLFTSTETKETNVRSMKEIDRHSSRFIYLQGAADGAIESDGTFGCSAGSKSTKLLELVKQFADNNESCLVYCDYYVTLDNIKSLLAVSNIKSRGVRVRVIETSGRCQQKAGFITKSMTDSATYVILCSRASSESENYPFINNVVLYDVPTTPITYVQMVGRITRRNTLYPDNLNAWIFNSDNIDQYKLQVIGAKIKMMQATTYDLSEVFPSEFVQDMDTASQLQKAKRYLLWKKSY